MNAEQILNSEGQHNYGQVEQMEEDEEIYDCIVAESEVLQCLNCSKRFKPEIYGINMSDKNDFNNEKDTFVCENCYFQLHFPFHQQKELFLKLNHVQPNTKYEFSFILEECYTDSCILGLFLSKHDLVNPFQKKNNLSNYIINSKVNNKEPTLEGSNFFVVESEDITLMQNTINFECNIFSFNKISPNQLLMMNDFQRSNVQVSVFPVMFSLFHCKQIRASAYTAKLYKKKFWNCLKHEQLFNVFLEQEKIYKENKRIKELKITYITQNNLMNSSKTTQYKSEQKPNNFQASGIKSSQINTPLLSSQLKNNNSDIGELNELFLRVKNFHKMFPFMYTNDFVVKMNDDAVIQYPAFTYHHNHPFDLRDFCYFNSVNPTWLCPICNKHKIFLKEIQLNFYLYALIQIQFLKDSQITAKIQNILSTNSQFDYQFFLEQLKDLSIKSISLQKQKDNSQEDKKSLTKENPVQEIKAFSLLREISENKQDQVKSKSSNTYDKNSLIRENNKNENKSIWHNNFKKKSKTTEDNYSSSIFDVNSYSSGIFNNRQPPSVEDYMEQENFLYPQQKCESNFNLFSNQQTKKESNGQVQLQQQQQPQQETSNMLESDDDKKQQQQSRVYTRLLPQTKSKQKSKTKTNSSSKSVESQQVQAQTENKPIQNQTVINKIEPIEIEEEQANKQNSLFNLIHNSKVSPKLDLEMQITDFSDLKDEFKQKMKEESLIAVPSEFFSDTSFLRSPLEISTLFERCYLFLDNSEKDSASTSILKLIRSVYGFGEESLLEKIFNTEILQNQYFVFNLFNTALVNQQNYQLLYLLLSKNPSTKTFFEVLIEIQKQLIRQEKQAQFYDLLTNFYTALISQKERSSSQIMLFERSESQVSNQNQAHKKIFLEKMVDCILGISIFKFQSTSNTSVIDIFQQMIFEFLFFKQQNIPTLVSIYDILQNYFSDQCNDIYIKIKESLSYQGYNL